MGKCDEGFEGVHGRGMVLGKNEKGSRLVAFCDEKELYIANT